MCGGGGSQQREVADGGLVGRWGRCSIYRHRPDSIRFHYTLLDVLKSSFVYRNNQCVILLKKYIHGHLRLNLGERQPEYRLLSDFTWALSRR